MIKLPRRPPRKSHLSMAPNQVKDINANGLDSDKHHQHPSSDHSSPISRKIRLCVSASTTFGQQVLIAYQSSSQSSPLSKRSPYHLSYEHQGGLWAITLPSVQKTLHYKYCIRHDNASAQPVWEAGPDRVIELATLPSIASQLLVRDAWRASPDPSQDIFSTAAFTRVLFRPDISVGQKLYEARENASFSEALINPPGSFVAIFRVFVERIEKGDCVYIVGNCTELGNEDPSKAIVLADTNAPFWHASIPLSKKHSQLRYRFLIRRGETVIAEDTIHRELALNDADRSFLSSTIAGTVPTVVAPSERSFSFKKKWRAAGIALPVFSIRSRRSCGIGEFPDLIKVVDFCKASGYQLLQLLPINDTNVYNDSRDSYPYSAVSSFALHPQYLNIDDLGIMPDDLRKEYESERDRLNQLEAIDVVDVTKVKRRFITEMFKLHRDEFLLSSEFTEWFDEHQCWLVPYALFRFFMLINGTAQFDQWGVRSKFSEKEMAAFADPTSFHFDHLALVYYTQFHLHKQLRAAAVYAEKNAVVFKGDLPIGVNRYCADTWVNPHLFRLHMQAGAPPDFFSKHGQNWLFPTYDWDVMSKDNYGWWRARLGHMARYFHAYRIDHILGFFRIWEIPERFRTGMSGRFFPCHAISRQELESLGLWDMDRYTKPYIHDGILQQCFKDDWLKIKERFFEPLYDNRLQFKKKYDTERKMESALLLPSDAPEHEKKRNEEITKTLFDFFNNVCLLQDEADEDLFHPRFMMQTTSSHAELPSDEWRRLLYNLQEDYMHQRQDKLWKRNGLERLPMMKEASDMLVCGEDLGLVPECVPSVMDETCIVSLAVQRMPPGDADFGVPSEYKYECVATTSSHDTSTFRGWWEEIPDDMRKKYWTQLMCRDGNVMPPAECTPEIVEWAIVDHLRSPAMWAIFPLQDLLGMDKSLRCKDAAAERINDPSNPTHVWCFRLHIDIETIMEDKQFIEKLLKLNKSHDRGTVY